MAAQSFGYVPGSGPSFKPISFSVHPKVYDTIARRAGVMNVRATEYARRLFEAAYAVRCAQEKDERHEDERLDMQVRLAFLMADCEPDYIAAAIGASEATVARILAAWRQTIGEIPAGVVSKPVGSAPAETVAPAPGAERPVPAKPAAKGGGRDPRSMAAYPPEIVERIRIMWAQGASGRAIAEAIGKTTSGFFKWAEKNRDICPRRRGERRR